MLKPSNHGGEGYLNKGFRIVYKTVFLMLLWIFSVMLVYPILHEGGHALAGLAVRAEQVSAGIFPQAYIRFRFAGVSRGELWFLSAAGMAAAPVFLLFFQAKNSLTRVLKAMLGAVCLAVAAVYLSISLPSACGLTLPEQLAALAENSALNAAGSVAVSFCAVMLSAVIVLRQKPVEALRSFFGLT